MKKTNIIFIILIFLFSCSGNDKKTTIFNKYLNNVFNISIPQNQKAFLMINLNSCEGCISYIVDYSETLINNQNYIIIFCDNSKFLPKYTMKFKNKKNVLFDIGNNFFNLNLSPFSDCIIYTKNKRIIKIMEINYKNIKDTLQYIDSILVNNN